MLERCCQPDHKSYQHYGGRGIVVCDRWRRDYRAFLSDMGPKPSPKHSIDRIDNDGPYSPENCRWATETEQKRNTSVNRLLSLDGETRCLSEWAERLGITPQALWRRLDRLGWPMERALTERQPSRYARPTNHAAE